MSPVHILTDSTADIPSGVAASLGIAVVPNLVYVGPDSYRDGVDLPPYALCERMARGTEILRTAHPPVCEFVDTYHRLLEADGDDRFLSIHVAGSLSGTVNAAWAGAQDLPNPAQVEVIDLGACALQASNGTSPG